MTWRGLHVMRRELEQESRDAQLLARYHMIFDSDAGRIVLADILKDLGACQDIDPRDPAANALRNFAETALREKVGALNYMAALGLIIGDA